MDGNDGQKEGVGKGRRRRGFMAVFALLARSLQQLSTFIITMLAASFMLPADYGIYSLAIIFVMLVQTISYSGYYHFIITSRDADERAILDTGFWMIMAVTAGGSLLMAVLAYPIGWMFRSEELGFVLLLMALVQPVGGLAIWYEAVLLREQRMRLHFGTLLATNIVSLIGGVVLLWYWQSLYALVAFRYIRLLSAAALYLVTVRRLPGLHFVRALAQQSTKFSGGLYGARVLNFVSRYAADLLLGLMYSTAEAGLYRFGNRLASGAIDIVGQPMRSFALTQFAAAGRAGRNLAHPLQRFSGTATLLTGGIAATIIVLAADVVETFFNPAYLAGVVVTYAMCIRAVLTLGTMVLEPALATESKTGLVMLFNLWWTIISIGSVFVFSPFGLDVLAWGQAGVMCASTASAFVVLKYKAGIAIGPAIRAVLVSAALCVLYGIALWQVWTYIEPLFAREAIAIAAGLAAAAVLGLITMVIGWKLRVFSLGVFSG